MKILILVIYSKNQSYDKMLEIHRKYVHKYNNVDVYFIQSSYEHNEPVFIENDMVYVRCLEEHNTILYKTLSTMDTLKNLWNKEYDFTIRTNISTIINIPKMTELLSLFQGKEMLYAGDLAGITEMNRHIRFALGTCIILSKHLANKMIDDIQKFTDRIADDVAIGLYVEENVPEAYDNNLNMAPFVFYTDKLVNGWNSNVNDFIDFSNKTNYKTNDKLNYICYRNKTNNRNEDINIMEYIYNHII